MGHSGSFSGLVIRKIAEITATPDINIGKAFGPKGSEKKGISNWVALAKNASATISTIKPVRRSDITSLHQAQRTWL